MGSLQWIYGLCDEAPWRLIFYSHELLFGFWTRMGRNWLLECFLRGALRAVCHPPPLPPPPAPANGRGRVIYQKAPYTYKKNTENRKRKSALALALASI